jgi:MFS family permease
VIGYAVIDRDNLRLKEARNMEHRDPERHHVRDEDEDAVGRKGGAASMAAGGAYAREREETGLASRDLVRWGPVWAGLLLALGIQLVLGMVGLAVALSSYNPNAANFGERVASTMSIWSVVSALIALFIGGFVAGRMAAVVGLRNGLVQGSVVWALAVIIGLVLSAFGVAGALGAATNIGTLMARGSALTGPETTQLVRSAAAGTWWAVVGAILAWAAAAGGGVLGAAAHEERIENP